MRNIEISTEVFVLIWAKRIDGEENENSILIRILGGKNPLAAGSVDRVDGRKRRSEVKWRDDVVAALKKLGGEASLAEIYDCVRSIRKAGSRTLPVSTDAVIRRELENNSSDSESFTGNFDLFYSVDGIGSGIWGLKKT